MKATVSKDDWAQTTCSSAVARLERALGSDGPNRGTERMMIEWHDPKVKLPNDGDECLLMPHSHGGICTVGVFGPIMWSAKNECWLDIFRDPEAGTMVRPDKVGCWTLWKLIAPPEGLPTPWPEESNDD